MQRRVPVLLLTVFENWFSKCYTCIKWGAAISANFELKCGIRQDGVLSPYLFAVFVDGIIDKIKQCGIGCYVGRSCLAVFMYADDILLLAPSVVALHKLLLICEEEISLLDMAINASKSCA